MIDMRALLADPDYAVEIDIERIVKGVQRGRTTVETSAETITGSRPQPASPRERESLPEADRVKETISVWTLTALTEDARILWADTTWRVASVESWADSDGTYTHVLAVRESLS